MRFLPKSIAALLICTAGVSAGINPASAAVIGVVAPKSGPYATLGTQVFEGARAAAELSGDTIVEVDESCEEPGGVAAAKALSEANAVAAIGFLCVETLNSAMPALAASKIPAITISVRSLIVMEDALRDGWPLFRMAPPEGAEADRLTDAISARWKANPIAFVDDGTIYGRELVSAVRQKLEPLGISPVFTDTLRPGQEQQIALIRRLQKAGATHLLLGTDRNDAAILARDAAAENLPLTIIGGEALRAANRPVPLADGTLAVGPPPYPSLPSAAQAVVTLRGRGVEPDGHVLPAYAATQVAARAAALAASGSEPVATILLKTAFDTAIGPIRFNEQHELDANPYTVLEWRGTDFVSQVTPTE